MDADWRLAFQGYRGAVARVIPVFPKLTAKQVQGIWRIQGTQFSKDSLSVVHSSAGTRFGCATTRYSCSSLSRRFALFWLWSGTTVLRVATRCCNGKRRRGLMSGRLSLCNSVHFTGDCIVPFVDRVLWFNRGRPKLQCR